MKNQTPERKERKTIRRSDEHKKMLEAGSKILAEQMAKLR